MTTELNGSSAPQNVEELGKLYDEEYYRTYLGPVSYSRAEPQWLPFFASIAENLIRVLHPNRVLDAGCALGFLVESFWDRGVEAWGIDVSPYAIAHVRRDMQQYCTVASLAEGIAGSFDLITCIEVIEHMPESQSLAAIGHMTKATDVILFSSTPYDVEQPMHFNVRPLAYWMHVFREHGFAPDLDFDASFVCSHAMLFRRSAQPPSDEVLRLYANFLHQRREIALRDGRVHTLQAENNALQSEKVALATYQERIRVLEQEQAAAAELQENVRSELESATREIEQLAALRMAGTASSTPSAGLSSADEVLAGLSNGVRSQSAALKAMEFRLGAIEQQNAYLAASLASVIDSKIWRTLVRGGGTLQRLFRL